MSVPASEPFPPPAHKQPYFKGAFFWYVTLQVTFLVALLTAITIYFFLAGIIYMDNPSAIDAQLEFVIKAVQPVASMVTIILCIGVARTHDTGFGRGILLFFGGNIVATIVSLPLIVVCVLSGEDSGLGWLGAFLLTLLVYWTGCIILIVRRRRKDAASRVRQEAITSFE